MHLRWALIALLLVLLLTFPQLLALVASLLSKPVVVAFGVGTVAGLNWHRRPPLARYRRGRR